MSALADVRRHWRELVRDEPGERFVHQNERMKRRSSGVRVVLAVVGALVTALGVVLLFIPGPGLPVLLVGLGLLAGLSATLARALDRAEPVLRHQARELRRGWDRLSRRAQALAAVGGVLGAGALALGAYHLIT